MARGHFHMPAQDNAGNLLSNIYVEVRRQTAGTPLAPIQNRAGSNLGNPALFADGEIDFYVVTGGFFQLRVYATGYEKYYYDVPIATGAGTDAEKLNGAAFSMVFSDETGTPPEAGEIRADNDTWASATALYISHVTTFETDIESQIDLLASGQRIVLTNGDGTQAAALVTGSRTDNGTWSSVPITPDAGEPVVGAIAFQFVRDGDDGVVQTIVAGDGIAVDDGDPANPEVSFDPDNLADPLALRTVLKIVIIEESDYAALSPPDADTIYHLIADAS